MRIFWYISLKWIEWSYSNFFKSDTHIVRGDIHLFQILSALKREDILWKNTRWKLTYGRKRELVTKRITSGTQCLNIGRIEFSRRILLIFFTDFFFYSREREEIILKKFSREKNFSVSALFIFFFANWRRLYSRLFWIKKKCSFSPILTRENEIKINNDYFINIIIIDIFTLYINK